MLEKKSVLPADAPCCLRELRASVVKPDSLEIFSLLQDCAEPEEVESLLASRLAAVRWRYDRANSLVWGLDGRFTTRSTCVGAI